MAFKQGHALIIGVGSYLHFFHADVPIALEDAQAIEKVIKDERLCGYPDIQVEMISDSQATFISKWRTIGTENHCASAPGSQENARAA